MKLAYETNCTFTSDTTFSGDPKSFVMTTSASFDGIEDGSSLYTLKATIPSERHNGPVAAVRLEATLRETEGAGKPTFDVTTAIYPRPGWTGPLTSALEAAGIRIIEKRTTLPTLGNMGVKGPHERLLEAIHLPTESPLQNWVIAKTGVTANTQDNALSVLNTLHQFSPLSDGQPILTDSTHATAWGLATCLRPDFLTETLLEQAQYVKSFLGLP